MVKRILHNLKRLPRKRLIALAAGIAAVVIVLVIIINAAAGPLPSWRDDSVARREIIDFVDGATDMLSGGYIPEEERVAVFDMDGTLICEKPLWVEFAAVKYRVENDMWMDSDLVTKLNEVLSYMYAEPPPEIWSMVTEVTGRAFAGMEADEFENYIARFMDTPHMGLEGRTYRQAIYKPMKELVGYLQKNGFDVYIVSGSERGVIRGALLDELGIERGRVIGAEMALYPGVTGEGSAMMLPADTVARGEERVTLNDGNEKVYNIVREIGRRPVLAFGNATGDFSMLNYTAGNRENPAKAFLLLHDDAEREFEYDADKHGEWLALAEQYGWTAVSMAGEFKTVF